MGSFKGTALKLQQLHNTEIRKKPFQGFEIENKYSDSFLAKKKESENLRKKKEVTFFDKEDDRKINSDGNSKMEQTRQMQLEEYKRKRHERALKAQQTREQKEKEKELRVEIQKLERDEKRKQTEMTRLAKDQELQKKRILAAKKAREIEARRRDGVASRQIRLQTLIEDKQFAILRKSEQEKIDKLDQIRLQEIKAANAKLNYQKTRSNHGKQLEKTTTKF